jgi:prepilin-type N-terminal cleavage/methylation domain-containing protein
MMGDGKRKKPEAFTLVEVLIALAIAAIGFGVILHSIGMQLSLVGNSLTRHQMLLYASQVLETSLANGLVEEQVTDAEISAAAEDDSDQGEASEAIARFVYGLETVPVTADPRVQQVTASIKGPSHHGLRLSAYRLRVKRD